MGVDVLVSDPKEVNDIKSVGIGFADDVDKVLPRKSWDSDANAD